MKSLVAVVSFAAVLLLVVACGDGDEAPDTPDHPETTPTAEVDDSGIPYTTETFRGYARQSLSSRWQDQFVPTASVQEAMLTPSQVSAYWIRGRRIHLRADIN